LLTKFKNWVLRRYAEHKEAVIITCYFNPQKSEYRRKAFQIFYDSVKHLNVRVVECVIGDNQSELVDIPNLKLVYTDSLLWHKEALLNGLIKELPPQFKYVFWIDADVLFTNRNWLVDSVTQLENGATIVQPFEYCFHLDKGELEPEDKEEIRELAQDKEYTAQNGRK